MPTNRGLIEDQFTWYETSLPLIERKRRGHFSTPPQLVEKILDACGYIPDKDLARVRVLDPACGSGNFLAAAAQRLLAFGTRSGLSLGDRASLIQSNLWGFDPDPISSFLAEMKLRAILQSNTFPPITAKRLHIHQADSLALPWEPCIDLFIANPPYLAAKNNDLSGYRSAQQRGQADSYLLFLNLALQVVRPGGWIGLVVPDPLLARANAVSERARLLDEATLHHLWHFSDVFVADVGAVVIIAQKCPARRMHSVSWIRGHWRSNSTFASQHQVQQSLFSRQPGAEFRYLISQGRGPALEHLRTYLEDTPANKHLLTPLGEFLSISRGEELGKGNPFIQNILPPLDTNKTSILHSRGDLYGRPAAAHPAAARPTGPLPPSTHEYANPDSTCNTRDLTCGQLALPTNYPVLRGGIDIHPYSPPTTDYQIARQAITKPLERYLSPKLLVVKSTDRLQAALDLNGHIALQTLYLLHPRNQHESLDQLYFFLALLNSRVLREYVYVLHTAYKWVQPQIEQRILASLPVPIVESVYRQQIIERARALEYACSRLGPVVEWNEHITGIYEEQERAICALYDSVLAGLFTDKGVIKYG